MDPCAAWDGVPCGPQRGPARSDYLADFDAAGHHFDAGEPEFRAAAIDTVSRRRRSAGPEVHVGAAGAGSPRPEARALSIDNTVRRRAHSEPPADLKPRTTRAELKLAMQAFGVMPDIDADVHHRRRCASPDAITTTHAQAAKMAASIRDIEGLLKRRHFHASPQPGTSLSPRLASKSLEMVDIDAHSRQPLGLSKTASAGALPTSSRCYDLAVETSAKYPGTPRGRTSTEFFQRTLEAKRYAKLLGRAGSSNLKSLAMVSEDDLKKLQKQDSSNRRMLEESQSEFNKMLLAIQSAKANESPPECYYRKRSSSKESIHSISTAASISDEAFQTFKSSKSAKYMPMCNVMEQDIYALAEEQETRAELAAEPECEPGPKVPINLRRVLSSITAGDDKMSVNLPEALADIKSSLIPVFQQQHDERSRSDVSELQAKLKPASLCEQQSYCGRGQRYPLRSSARQAKQ